MVVLQVQDLQVRLAWHSKMVKDKIVSAVAAWLVSKLKEGMLFKELSGVYRVNADFFICVRTSRGLCNFVVNDFA